MNTYFRILPFVFFSVMIAALVSVTGCEKSGVSGSGALEAAKAKIKSDEAKAVEEAKAAAARNAAAEAKRKAEAEAKREANKAPGNTKTTDAIARDDDDKAIIERLQKQDTFKTVAEELKSKPRKWQPLLLAALQHENENVRTQVARIININELKSEEVSAAWSEALMNEASDVIRENWGYDLRLYKDPAMLPALRKAFSRAESPAALGNIAETLAAMNDRESLPQIIEALQMTREVMAQQFLLAALKRMPDSTARPVVEGLLTSKTELIRLNARKVLGHINDFEGGAGKLIGKWKINIPALLENNPAMQTQIDTKLEAKSLKESFMGSVSLEFTADAVVTDMGGTTKRSAYTVKSSEEQKFLLEIKAVGKDNTEDFSVTFYDNDHMVMEKVGDQLKLTLARD